MLVTSIFFFFKMFSKSAVLRVVKSLDCVKEINLLLTLYHTIPTLIDPKKGSFWKHCGKRRKCWKPAFSPFPTMFSTQSKTKIIIWASFILLSANTFNVVTSKILSFGKELTDHGLTLSQATNFRLFQTERVCRQQLQIWWKWQKGLQRVENTIGKGELARYEQFLIFPQCF